MTGPGTDQYLFENDDEENEDDEDLDEEDADERDEDDVAWDNEHAPGSDHRDY